MTHLFREQSVIIYDQRQRVCTVVFDEAGRDVSTWRRGSSSRGNEILRDRRWWEVVSERQRVTAIFCVEHVWVTSASYGIEYRLHQLRIETLCCSVALFAYPAVKKAVKKAIIAANTVPGVGWKGLCRPA